MLAACRFIPARETQDREAGGRGRRRFIPARAGNTTTRWCCGRAGTVHPRTCGEHACADRAASAASGSSPHVRGTQRAGPPPLGANRFIPARAGNTGGAAAPWHVAPVHPRTCGEHPVRGTMNALFIGSSPHVRGTRICPLSPRRCPRFIPARAGNTVDDLPEPVAPAVHPRTCGEHPDLPGDGAERHRFIPARAGNTALLADGPAAGPVHPRTCGEHLDGLPPPDPWFGSSPHVRGTPPHDRLGLRRFRFIPARAGNTLPTARFLPLPSVHPRTCGEHYETWDEEKRMDGSSPHVRGTLRGAGLMRPRPAVHPRTCGEHFTGSERTSDGYGSSPHVRGTPPWPRCGPPAARFIPARAGNTGATRSTGGAGTVHPRTCGEHGRSTYDSHGASGSSPHVRGTPSFFLSLSRIARFIPARAGNTASWRGGASRASVHPRTCGEHLPPSVDGDAAVGSSPHVRGTRRPGRDGGRIRRFIPARAGNTTRACSPS